MEQGRDAVTPGVPADDVAARYARPPRRGGRALAVAVAVLGGLLAVSAFALVTRAVLADDVRWREVSFEVVDDHLVRTTFEVYADPGDRLRCQVRAADARYGDVGQVDVDLDPLAERATSVTTEVRTTSRAVTSSVRTCILVP
ncbi:DUF4307 domain-containing protein [Aquipuribacter nitratireducens]|uniref:DUF4307 domain-containing protein n=1 Tax=Aquipuribacter nitratireducens TaxID=650104 RepID=A0ABW0GJ16_9MICO